MEFRKVTLDEISINGGSYGIGASAVEYNQDLYTYLRITLDKMFLESKQANLLVQQNHIVYHQ